MQRLDQEMLNQKCIQKNGLIEDINQTMLYFNILKSIQLKGDEEAPKQSGFSSEPF